MIDNQKYMSHIYLYKSSRVLNQKRISLSDKETNLYHYIFKTLLNSNNLNSNPYQIRKRIYLYYYIFKTLLNSNNLNSNPYQIRKRIYLYYYIFKTLLNNNNLNANFLIR